MLTLAIALGAAVSILLTELTGLSAGGIIAPGYVALVLDRPLALAGLLVIALVTFGLVRAITPLVALYGTRRFGVTVLIGLGLSAGAQAVQPYLDTAWVDSVGLGHIVPGLIAHQLDRQGLLPTLLMLAIAAPLVRALTILAMRW